MNIVNEVASTILGAVKNLAKVGSSPDRWERYCQSVGLPVQELNWPNHVVQLAELDNMIGLLVAPDEFIAGLREGALDAVLFPENPVSQFSHIVSAMNLKLLMALRLWTLVGVTLAVRDRGGVPQNLWT